MKEKNIVTRMIAQPKKNRIDGKQEILKCGMPVTAFSKFIIPLLSERHLSKLKELTLKVRRNGTPIRSIVIIMMSR